MIMNYNTDMSYFTTINSFKLTADYNSTSYMRVQFSANSKYINFAINKKPNEKTNDTFEEYEAKKENGITFVTFRKPADAYYLYLNVFLAGDTNNDKLKNFVFKWELKKQLL